jgi:hypothetical protein
MKSATRQALTCVLLVLYGGITLLDQGLHLLVPSEAHHHCVELVGGVAGGGYDDCGLALCGARHRSVPEKGAGGHAWVELRSGGRAESSHICPICAFLIQARSGQLQLFTAVDWRPLVAYVAVATEHLQFQALLGPYAPRGPPRPCA